MLKKERQQLILAELKAQARVVTANLSTQLGTSEDTIRRDLNELAKLGQLTKVHGGAMAVAEPVEAHTQRAAALIAEGLQQLFSYNSAPNIKLVFSLEMQTI